MNEADALLRQSSRLMEDAAEGVALAARALRVERSELGFDVPVVEDRVQALMGRMRGNYDASVIRRDHPKLCNMVAWAVSVGLPWDQIARVSGLSWEAIQAIAKAESVSIREFKDRNAKVIQSLIEAANGVLLRKIERGEIGVLDYKFLVELHALQTGEATSRVEHRHVVSAVDDQMRELYQGVRDVTPGVEGLGMGLAGGNLPAMGALGAGERVPGAVRELVREVVVERVPVDTEPTDTNV